MKKIIPCLWFDGRAEEAANFYVSLFEDSKILNVSRYGEAGAKASGQPEGSAMTVSFILRGQEYLALNSGPQFRFSEAVSFIVDCATQEEVDRYWRRLSEGGEEGQCGWLKDKFGLSWQIVPDALPELLQDADPERAERVMRAMISMKKLDIKTLQAA